MRSRTPSRRRSPRSVLGPIATAIACSLALTVLAPSAASAADTVAPSTSDAPAAQTSAAASLTAAAVPSGSDAAPTESASTAPAPSETAAPQAPVAQPAPSAPAPVPSAQPTPSAQPAPTTEPVPSTEPAPTGAVTPAPSAPAPEQPAPAPAAPADPTAREAPASPAESPVAEVADAPIAPLAVGGPEAEVETPSLHWLVSPAAAGSTFEVQHRSRTGTELGGETWWSDWSAWSTSATVADCTVGCTASGDLDLDVGELQISQAGAHQIAVNSRTAEHEYRVRPATPPAGRFWTDTSWRSASLTTTSADLGTFTTTANAALACTAGSVYSLGPGTDDTIRLVPTSSGSFSLPVPGLASGDALGIGAGGTSAYLIERSSDNASGINSIRRYSVATGWETFAGLTGFESNYRYTAGAVNPANGVYYLAGFGNGNADQAIIYRFVPGVGIQKVGTFPASASTQKATGDLAFDAAGNLYAIITTESGATQIFTISAGALASAAGGTLAVANATPSISAAGSVGAAYDADGRLFLGTATAMRRYNPATQAFEGGSIAIPTSTDLASCLTPSTLTVVKDVVGRVSSSDQFTVQALNPSGTVVASATTAGTATGPQPSRAAGPVVALAGAAYRVTETFSNGNGSSYAVGYSCIDESGSTVAVGTGTPGSGTVTIPSGASVVCTIRNAPLTGSVIIRKAVEEADGTDRAGGGAGWQVSAGVTGTGASLVGTPTQTTAGAPTALYGTASWGLTFAAASSRASVTVSEAQQSGYVLQSGACIVRPIDAPPFAQSFTTAAGTTLPQVAPGTRIECTFVNRQQPTRLTLVNQVDGDADPSAWNLTATPTGGSPIVFTSGVAQDVAAGAYALSATGGPATYVGGAWSCIDQGGGAVAVTSATVTVAVGTRVTCTVTQQTAHVVLLKHIDAAMAGSLLPEDFELTAAPVDATLGLSPTTVQGAEAADADNTVTVRPGAAYALSESSSYAYLQLRLQRLEGSTWVDVTSSEITAPAPGQTATYRFVNAAPPALALPVTGGLGADAYLFAGLALLVLSAAALLIRMRVVRLRGRRT